jgi:ketosteroid isomerase-like protein
VKRSNIELMIGWLDALRRGDREAVAASLDPDIVWYGRRPDLICHGPEEVVETFISQRDQGYDIDSLELIGGMDSVVLHARLPDRHSVDGTSIDGELYNVFSVSGGKVTRIKDFVRRDQALAAAGIPEPLGRPASDAIGI